MLDDPVTESVPAANRCNVAAVRVPLISIVSDASKLAAFVNTRVEVSRTVMLGAYLCMNASRLPR